MYTPPYFADLHCHPSMKPFYSLKDGKRESLWKEFEEKKSCGNALLDSMIAQMTKYSQANFQKCADNKVLLLFNSLYPVELPWFDMTGLGKLIVGKNRRRRISECLTNFSEETLEDLFFQCVENNEKSFDYFDRLEREYRYIVSESQDPLHPFTILTDYEGYLRWKQKSLSTDPATKSKKEIAVILCIEGAHSLFSFTGYEKLKEFDPGLVQSDHWAQKQSYLTMLETNISKLKRWGDKGSHAPLYITFSHHFWNLFAGHASSIDNPFLNQKEGRDTDISTLGRAAIELLLQRVPDGRRILIDVKHLSLRARESYYSIVNTRRSQNDPVPMIASHAAVTGISKNTRRPHSFFNSSDINLFNEDIIEICNSDGLIGIMMEEGRLVNKAVMKLVKRSYGAYSDKSRAFYATAVLANILHIVDMAGEKAWNCVCLGSDFDGMINSLDTFDSVAAYPLLFQTLHDMLSNGTPIRFPGGAGDEVYAGATNEVLFSSQKIKELMYGQTVDTIMGKLAYSNIERFLHSYFTEHYLKPAQVIA